MYNQVVLVDQQDQMIGVKDKLQAHYDGDLHRAFSVFLFNNNGDMLLQKRALAKYHSGGLWSNACCSHPFADESLEDAGARRLSEELGIESTVTHGFSFIYKAELDNGFTEHEFDHVLVAKCQQVPDINELEACEYQYMAMDRLLSLVQKQPQQFTAWFVLLMSEHYQQLLEAKNSLFEQ